MATQERAETMVALAIRIHTQIVHVVGQHHECLFDR
jgi:hypothetical protein